jgi:hypothetical protein
MSADSSGPTFVPGSVVVVRNEEWLVTSVEDTAYGPLVRAWAG